MAKLAMLKSSKKRWFVNAQKRWSMVQLVYCQREAPAISTADHQGFHGLPSLMGHACLKVELKPAPATSKPLIKVSVNVDAREGTVQKGSYTAMSNNENVAIL